MSTAISVTVNINVASENWPPRPTAVAGAVCGRGVMVVATAASVLLSSVSGQ
jgi:hypothetical protein